MTTTAHFDGRVFVPDGPVDLPIGQIVEVTIPAVVPSPAPTALAKLLAKLSELPTDESWPADGAAQIDHYLYETPKRS